MGKYTITVGQNLYDISMHLYGSTEGIVDLMIQNPELSLEDKLKAGNTLQYTDDFTINPDIIAYNKAHGIIPAAGERHVYYKEPSFRKVMEFHLPAGRTSAGITFSGRGKLEMDWGDNSALQEATITANPITLQHNFDNTTPDKRKIRIYGTGLSFEILDITLVQADSAFFLQPVYVEKFILRKAEINIGFLSLLKGTYDMDLAGMATADLTSLLKSKRLMKLNLSNTNLKESVLDEFLIGLVRRYEERRNCHILLTLRPSGIYREPPCDEAGNYNPTTGMEAVWILTHEPSWNEAGYWKIQINNEIYTTQP